MRKLLVLALIAFAAWYGWKHYPELTRHRPSHQAVIQNESGTGLTRVRLQVDGQTLVKEEIADGQSATMPFRVNDDATFVLTWQWADRAGEQTWRGGMVPRGPMMQRHVFHIDGEGNVMYRPENL
jgi:hypothetical protein